MQIKFGSATRLDRVATVAARNTGW